MQYAGVTVQLHLIGRIIHYSFAAKTVKKDINADTKPSKY